MAHCSALRLNTINSVVAAAASLVAAHSDSVLGLAEHRFLIAQKH